jgi:hypothetical protein
MKNLLRSILLSITIYCLLTIPHFIFMYTWGKNGIEYSNEVIAMLATLSSILSVYIINIKFK